jgi:hypothetical protein
MPKFSIIKYQARYFDVWNKFVENSNEGTLFHRLDFLAYHKNKFVENELHLMVLKGTSLYAVLPLAIFEQNGKKLAKSPYGASYGGLVFAEPLKYSEAKSIVQILKNFLKNEKVDELLLTPPIGIYQKTYSETYTFAMLEQGFEAINNDITSIVLLNSKNIPVEVFTSRARNMAAKAIKSGVSIKENCPAGVFWELMVQTFSKHGTNPTHTFDEFETLTERFPDKIYTDVAFIRNTPVAGMACFVLNQRAIMSFYLCSNPAFKHTQALSLLVYRGIIKAQAQGFNSFDFGTSSVNMQARENIFMFKEAFGAVGRFRTTYFAKL